MADIFVGQTPAVGVELKAHAVPAHKITIIPNALPKGWAAVTHDRARTRRDLGLPDCPMVLYSGRLSAEKGIDLLLDAWGRVAARTPGVLLLMGDGPERGRIERRLQAADIADSVRLLGWRDDLEACYQAADVFAFASPSETFGNALAEAMASGLAIVTTPVGVALTSIEHERNGLISEHRAEDFAGQLVRLMTDAPLRRRLGAAARHDAQRLFGADKMLQDYLATYREVTRARTLGATTPLARTPCAKP